MRRWPIPVFLIPALGLLAACESSSDGPPQFAELVPVAMMAAAVPPPPPAPPPAPVDSSKTAPMATGPAYGGHLASYFREADAERGWNIIVHQQASIGSLTRHIVPVQTPKGRMVRLIAGDFPNADEATRFCTWAHQQQLYCAVMAVGPGGEAAKPLPASSPRPASRARRRG